MGWCLIFFTCPHVHRSCTLSYHLLRLTGLCAGETWCANLLASILLMPPSHRNVGWRAVLCCRLVLLSLSAVLILGESHSHWITFGDGSRERFRPAGNRMSSFTRGGQLRQPYVIIYTHGGQLGQPYDHHSHARWSVVSLPLTSCRRVFCGGKLSQI